jgi:molybdopterin synthase catalytic subunit
MHIEVELTSRVLEPFPELPARWTGLAGARAEFVGLVRGMEADRPIRALEYEAYQPMADLLLGQALEELGREHPCLYVRVMHRLGVVPVGEAAIHLVVLAAHRREAFALMAAFMDRLKQEVPIWKVRAVST